MAFLKRVKRLKLKVKRLNVRTPFLVMLLFTFNFQLLTFSYAERIKDIAAFEGVRENQLVGYGLVVGLNGTGDSLDKAVFTRESLIGMLERLGVNARDVDLDTRNVAAVMATGSLPAFGRQ